jgi:transposase-like protein
MATDRCGSTETVSGDPCRWKPAESCPYHESGLSAPKTRAAELLRSGEYARYEVAKQCGVEPRTLRRWVNQHPQLSDAAEAGDEAQYQEVERSWIERLKEGDHSGAEMIFYLKNRRPERWRDRKSIEHSGPEGGPIEVDVDDARERLTRQLDRLTDGSRENGRPVRTNGR